MIERDAIFIREISAISGQEWSEVSSRQANQQVPDREVLVFATPSGRALLSHNRRHFIALHAGGTVAHAGIVACTVDADARAQRLGQARCLRVASPRRQQSMPATCTCATTPMRCAVVLKAGCFRKRRMNSAARPSNPSSHTRP